MIWVLGFWSAAAFSSWALDCGRRRICIWGLCRIIRGRSSSSSMAGKLLAEAAAPPAPPERLPLAAPDGSSSDGEAAALPGMARSSFVSLLSRDASCSSSISSQLSSTWSCPAADAALLAILSTIRPQSSPQPTARFGATPLPDGHTTTERSWNRFETGYGKFDDERISKNYTPREKKR